MLVTIASPQKSKTLLTVRCTEPQTIYDMMARYDITCSQVWGNNLYLSARAPCVALQKHKMTHVKVNTIFPHDPCCKSPRPEVPHHAMPWIKMSTQFAVMKHKPYALPAAMGQDSPGSSRESNVASKVVIYFNNEGQDLQSALREDGRFHDRVICTDDEGDGQNEKLMMTIQSENMSLTILGNDIALTILQIYAYIAFLVQNIWSVYPICLGQSSVSTSEGPIIISDDDVDVESDGGHSSLGENIHQHKLHTVT